MYAVMRVSMGNLLHFQWQLSHPTFNVTSSKACKTVRDELCATIILPYFVDDGISNESRVQCIFSVNVSSSIAISLKTEV